MPSPKPFFPAGTVAFVLVCASVAFAVEPPVPVSPGDGTSVATVERRCPTFSWSGVDDASAYEITLYRLQEPEAEAARRGESWAIFPEDEVLRRTLPGGARSWSATMEDALEPGAVCAWFIRAEVAGEFTEWSEARLLGVSAQPSSDQVRQAIDVLSRHLEGRGEGGSSRSSGGVGVPVRPRAASAEATEGMPGSEAQLAALPSPVKTAIRAEASGTSGATFGVHGISHGSAGSVGVIGQTTSASGETVGVYGEVASISGIAGVFENTAGGRVLSARGAGGFEVLGVGGDGTVSYGAKGRHGNGHSGILGYEDGGVEGRHNNGNFGILGEEDYGVFGQHSGGNWGSLGGANVGVHGSSADAWAGFFWGKVWIGSFSASTGLHHQGTITLDHRVQANDEDGLEFATDDGVARLELHDDGGINLGPGNWPFLEVRKITGVSMPAGSATLISYPAGYNQDNTCILSIEVYRSLTDTWLLLSDIDDLHLMEGHILLDAYWIDSNPFRIWALKME